MEKRDYETPVLERVGSVEEITQGNSSGGVTDDNFPANTPFADLTFS